MKKICIIGGGIAGLYNCIKYIDTDIQIDIIDNKNEIEIDTSDNYIYNLYNENHKTYINLLKKFNIDSIELNITYNDNILSLINTVIEKSKLIPQNICASYTFINLCKQFLNNNEFDIIQNELNRFNILNYINACDFIYIIKNDLNKNLKYFYITNININLLISRMTELINSSSNINTIYNMEIKNINYNNNIFTINNNNIFCYEYVISTLSNNNLIDLNILPFQNNKRLLNSITNINICYIKKLIDKLINNNIDINSIEINNIIRNKLLNDLHIIYPQTKKEIKKIGVWNTKEELNNNIMFRENIKFLFNNKFYICNLSYSKNNLFINYLLYNIDSTNFIKLKKNKKNKINIRLV